MRHKFVVKLKRISYNAFRNMTTTRVRRRIVERFANKTGLIYFGSVDQRKDDHKLIRGFTASATHVDNHFSVGTIDGYGISLVDRSDVFIDEKQETKFKNWIIFALDLKDNHEVPHLFINANNHEPILFESIFTMNPTFSKIELGLFENYPIDFTSRFSLYCSMKDVVEAERLFPANSCMILGAHLWPYSVEIKDGTVFIYSDDKKVTANSLNIMTNVGLWLARHLDYMVNQI